MRRPLLVVPIMGAVFSFSYMVAIINGHNAPRWLIVLAFMAFGVINIINAINLYRDY